MRRTPRRMTATRACAKRVGAKREGSPRACRRQRRRQRRRPRRPRPQPRTRPRPAAAAAGRARGPRTRRPRCAPFGARRARRACPTGGEARTRLRRAGTRCSTGRTRTAEARGLMINQPSGSVGRCGAEGLWRDGRGVRGGSGGSGSAAAHSGSTSSISRAWRERRAVLGRARTTANAGGGANEDAAAAVSAAAVAATTSRDAPPERKPERAVPGMVSVVVLPLCTSAANAAASMPLCGPRPAAAVNAAAKRERACRRWFCLIKRQTE